VPYRHGKGTLVIEEHLMVNLNYVAVVVAAVAVFAFAAVYYTLLARQRAALSPAAAAAAAKRSRPPAWLMALELGKALVVAFVVAGLVSLIGITDWTGALELGFALWIAFPVVLLIGSVTQENVPWKLGAIHAGDWLAKLLIIAVIVSLWR
jgi:predicted Co/Zn/Cd cation transporter (cation efflux family)